MRKDSTGIYREGDATTPLTSKHWSVIIPCVRGYLARLQTDLEEYNRHQEIMEAEGRTNHRDYDVIASELHWVRTRIQRCCEIIDHGIEECEKAANEADH